METLIIDYTECTPRVVFGATGKMHMDGKSMPEDVKKFYFPLIDWVVNLECDKVDFTMKFEYLNTASSKEMLELLKCLDSNYKVKEINVNWYYESDDFDTLELGQIYQESLNRMQFNYFECIEEF